MLWLFAPNVLSPPELVLKSKKASVLGCKKCGGGLEVKVEKPKKRQKEKTERTTKAAPQAGQGEPVGPRPKK